uniref:WLM domain-containing protein n=2 Tax=Kalanchoe fedtschenkoi TaxID=63787 RepID=A0A7N0TIP2_KALFE
MRYLGASHTLETLKRYFACFYFVGKKKMQLEDGNLNLSVIWRGKKFVVEISSGASLGDLGRELHKLTSVSEDTMRLLMPKSSIAGSKLLHPFADGHSHLSLQEAFLEEGKAIRMMGATKDELDEIIKNEKANLRIAGFDEEERRSRQRTLARTQIPLKLPQGIYVFCEFRTLDLPGVELNPPPSEALKRMHRLAADPGIVAIMNKHHWRVGIMSEMAPEGYVGISSVCILGLNKNQGEEISLRLRTDDLKGFRKYEIIKKTLLHELAHMVYSEHDANFHALNSQLNKEALSLDWTRSRSQTLSRSAHSAHYDEEFDMEDCTSTSQKLGGDTSGLLRSARSSSVTAAYNRLASVSVSELAREVKDTDLALYTLHEQPKSNAENQTEIELDPDHSAVVENMEPDLYIDPQESLRMSKTAVVDGLGEVEVLVRAKTLEEPDPDDAMSQSNNLGVMYNLDGCYLPNEQREGHIETDPDSMRNGATPYLHSVHPNNKPRISMDEPILADQGTLSHNCSVALSDELVTDQESTYKEPDLDDVSDILDRDTHTEVSSNVSVRMDIYEPDPDDEEMKRIQDPVVILCSRLQKAVDLLLSEVKPGNVDAVLKTLAKIISNVIQHPNDLKFKRLRKANPAFARNIANYKAAMEILSLIGFHEELISSDSGSPESYMVLKRNDPGLLWLAKSSLDAYSS